MSQSELERLEREYVEAGYDLSLLEARLRLTPEQRILTHERAKAQAKALRRAFEESNERVRVADPKAH